MRKKKREKRNKEMNKISSWQREKINAALDEYITDRTSDDRKELIGNLKGYINRQRYWDADKIAEISSDALNVLDIILFKKIKKAVETNRRNDAVLYLHAFDFANGGPTYHNDTLVWIGDDIKEQKNDLSMSESEARFFYIIATTINKAITIVDEELGKIPEEIDVDPILRTYKMYDFQDALEDAATCNDIRNLKPETLDIAARALVIEIDYCLENFSGDRFAECRLYYVRALACCLDKQLYDEILDSIELS